MTLEFRVVCNEDSRLNILSNFDVSLACGEGSGSPSEVEDVALKVLPGVTEILCDIELLVNFTRLIISKVSARGPSSGKCP